MLLTLNHNCRIRRSLTALEWGLAPHTDEFIKVRKIPRIWGSRVSGTQVDRVYPKGNHYA